MKLRMIACLILGIHWTQPIDSTTAPSAPSCSSSDMGVYAGLSSDEACHLARAYETGTPDLFPDADKAKLLYVHAMGLDSIWARYYIGLCHLYGYLNTPIDITEGLKLVRSAAKLDCREANHFLGQIYESGYFEMPTDTVEAFQFYFRAANLNYAEACYIVGKAYEDSTYIGIKNSALAFFYMKKASDLCYGYADFILGGAYETGGIYLVEKDLGKALEHYIRAVSLGVTEAKERLSLTTGDAD
jgi:TPR repeat protein